MAAAEQGKFWEYHDKLFANQAKLQKENLFQYAKEVGLDVKRFEQAFTTAKYKDAIDADAKEAASLGASGTPALLLNGHFLSGAQPFEAFAKVINGELSRQKLPIPPEAASVGG